eukprot:TRINITY_DN10766_c0_g1_i1.p1 TRINITY_DN10766_c0_g1~~TRINITY_DN10766_c0_g1_i1.p1  ORF type:complete len:256 (-),score=43.71 TRINITY_DN10766_c0_g1_i1:370-1137(-)
MVNLLGNIFLLLPITILGEFGDIVRDDKDDSTNDHSREVDTNDGTHPYYDKEGWKVAEDKVTVDGINEQFQYNEVLEDDVGCNHISETYSDHFIRSHKDKYANYRTRPEYRTKEMINQHSAAHYLQDQNDYQDTKPISQDQYTAKPDRPLRESASYSDNYNRAPYAKYNKVQSTKHVPSQAPGILLFVIDLLESALKSRRPKIRNRLDFENNPTVNLGDRVTIDTVTAVQELMLQFLNWGAFIATDLLFQLFWPV